MRGIKIADFAGAKKIREEGFLDPRSDEFAQNQALGRGVGMGVMTAPVGALAGLKAPIKSRVGKALLGLAVPATAGTAYYKHKVRQFREEQDKGNNPATGKPFNVERIERLQRRAKKRTSKTAGIAVLRW